jgi:hypothetical protein
MFNFFKKDESTALKNHIKKLTKEIYKSGGAIGVCGDFVDFLIKDELFKTLGIFNKSKLPHSESKLMWAAILLLNDIKNPPDFVTKENLEYMNAVSKASFIYSSSAVTDDELAELLLMPSTKALEAIQQRKEPYEAAWNNWLTSDVDIDNLSTIILNKF